MTTEGAPNSPERLAQIAEQAAGTRTFHRSDYARFARAIRKARQVKGDQYTAKADKYAIKVEKLANTLILAFMADSPEFDAEKFLAGTQIPAKPEYDEPDEDDQSVLHDSASYAEGDEL